LTAQTSVTPETVQDFLRSELVDLGVEEDSITTDTKFDALDIDSLDIADLMVSVKTRFGVVIPRAELAEVSIGGLVDRIVSESAS
jgi:acyl carrier protein